MEEKNDIPIVNVLDPANLPMEKSKPKRSMIVLLAMVVAGSGSWLWLNREWLRAQLAADDEPGSPVQG
jgi:LPS O-antigen subunit length determinant protein (WzzB/FepE family)